jgi:hypothetical protein
MSPALAVLELADVEVVLLEDASTQFGPSPRLPPSIRVWPHHVVRKG